MKIKVFILITIVFFVSILYADETIKKVVFKGSKLSKNVALYNRSGNIFQPDSLASDSLKIVSYFQKLGWFDCIVAINIKKNDNDIVMSYEIDRRDRYLLAVHLNEVMKQSEFYDDVFTAISYYENKPAVVSNIESLTNDILNIYADNGYPYCEVRVKDINLSANPTLAELTLDINPGPEVVVERFEFKGRKNLDYDFLQTYANLFSPIVYSSRHFKLAQRRLSLASFLDDIDDYYLRYSKTPENGVVVFPIKETAPLVIDGALGFSSKNKNFYGKLNAVISNVLGKGRKLEFDWQKKDKFSRNIKFTFSEPYPLGMPFKFELAAYQDDRDSLYIESGGDIGLYYISSDTYIYGAALGISRINPESYGRTIIPIKNRQKLSVSFSADTRDYPANPLTGDYFFMEGKIIRETTKQDENFPAVSDDYRTMNFKGEKYLRITNSSTLMGRLHGKGDFSEAVPLDRQFPLGGMGSLRGYSQDFFYVLRYGTVSIEYRLLTSKTGRAYIFTDMAVFQILQTLRASNTNSQESNNETSYKAGFGIGLTASVRGGLATIEIAAPSDEGLASAKLHFGLKAGF